MQRDIARIRDMLDAATEARELCQGLDAASFEDDRRTQLAVAHLIVIIGEAASNTAGDFRSVHPDVPWREARTMRNFIVHEYEHVSSERVWETVQHSLPALIEQLAAILDENE